MELRQLRTFQTVVEQRSLAHAAEALGYAQSTITLHLQQLEADLQVELFARAGRRLVLTKAGSVAYQRTQQVLSQVAALRQEMADIAAGESGVVRLGVIEPIASLRLPPILVRYARAHPKVRVTVEVAGTGAISGRVADGQLDVGICSPPDNHHELAFEPLLAEPIVVLVPDHHSLALAEHVTPAGLCEHALLLTEPGCAWRRLIERALLEQGAVIRCGMEIGSMAAVSQAVARGLGPALVPAAMVVAAPAGTVVRQIEGLELRLPVGFVSRHADQGTQPSRALAAMLTLLRKRLPSPD